MPDGRPVVSRIIPYEESYHGAFEQDGPDLHLVLDEHNMIACPLFATEGRIFSKQIRGDSGCHRQFGIFIAHGSQIRAGGQLPPADILDLAPTILQLLGRPIPRVLDGRVLEEIFVSPPQISFEESETLLPEGNGRPGFTEEESAQVEERLRTLGYL